MLGQSVLQLKGTHIPKGTMAFFKSSGSWPPFRKRACVCRFWHEASGSRVRLTSGSPGPLRPRQPMYVIVKPNPMNPLLHGIPVKILTHDPWAMENDLVDFQAVVGKKR